MSFFTNNHTHRHHLLPFHLFGRVLFCVFILAFSQLDAQQPAPSKALENLMKQQAMQLQSNDASESTINKLANEYKTLLRQSPGDKTLIYIQLGKLYSEFRNQRLRDYNQAVQYYNESLETIGGNDDALRAEILENIAFCYYRPSAFHNIAKAREYFLKAAQLNRAYAVQLARMSLFGWGAPQDYFLACCLYDIATRDGWEGGMENYSYLMHVLDADAAGRLDSLHLSGLEKGYFYRVIADQPTRSFTSMILAAEMGFATAEFEMGLIYEDPSQSNYEEAFRWYRLAADHGYDPARTKLAKLCLDHVMDTASGNIFERLPNGRYANRVHDQVYRECEHMLMIPAQNGYAPAQYYLGQMYMNGDPNGTTKRDYRKAYYWLLLSRTNGMTEAVGELAKLDKMMDNAKDQIPTADYKNIFLRVKNDAQKNDLATTCLNRIIHSNAWNRPRYIRSTYYTTRMGDKTIPIPDKSQTGVQTAQFYQETYDLFIAILKNMSRHQIDYSDHERKHYQYMMMQLRPRAKIVCPSAEITASPWESWDGR